MNVGPSNYRHPVQRNRAAAIAIGKSIDDGGGPVDPFTGQPLIAASPARFVCQNDNVVPARFDDREAVRNPPGVPFNRDDLDRLLLPLGFEKRRKWSSNIGKHRWRIANLAVVWLDDFSRARIQRLPGAEQCLDDAPYARTNFELRSHLAGAFFDVARHATMLGITATDCLNRRVAAYPELFAWVNNDPDEPWALA